MIYETTPDQDLLLQVLLDNGLYQAGNIETLFPILVGNIFLEAERVQKQKLIEQLQDLEVSDLQSLVLNNSIQINKNIN